MKNKFCGLLFLSFFTLPLHAQRIGFADEAWKKIRTEHFDVIFTAKQQDLGLYYADQAERAYENLATVFTNRNERSVIVVNDTTDLSNGYATRIPYAHIMVYAVPIGAQETLSEAGEWGRELITHELTHIMQFEPALGFYRFLRPVFGTIVAPNILMPLWWKEGMAVEMETQFSPQGRLRSKFQDATLRAFVLDRKLFDYKLAQANEVLPSWPYGGRPYLFGSLMWSSIVQDSNVSSVNQIVSRQGERVPYALEEPLHEILNHNYEAQYNKALDRIDQNGLEQLEALKKQELSNIQILKSPKAQNLSSPTWSQVAKALAVIEQVDGEGQLAFYDENLQWLKLKRRPSGSLSDLNFHPQEKKLLYAKAELFDSKHRLSDLYVYDLDQEKSERLTRGERAREASFSDQGDKVVFISTFDGRTQVKTLNLKTKQISLIAAGDFKHRYQAPIFWNDNEILVTKRDPNGSQKLFSLGRTDRIEKAVSLDFADIRFLKKGILAEKPGLYFTSSQNGVHNLYFTEDLKTATAVSHVATGVWSYAVNAAQNLAWATVMTSDGFQVGSFPLQKRSALPTIENKLIANYSFNEKIRPDLTSLQVEDYSSGAYLWPTYWIPYVATSSSSRGVYLQAQTSGHDPVNIHEYSLLANYDTDLRRAGFAGFYINSSTDYPVILASTIQNQALGNVSNIVETKTGVLGVVPSVFKISKNLTFQIGAQYQDTNGLNLQTQHWGPYALATYLDYGQSIFEISPDNGWGAYLKYENMKNLKNSRDFNRVAASVVGYFSPWLPRYHVMMTRVSTLLTFETLPSRFGTSNGSLFFNSDLLLPQFVLRGYQPSQFYGRSLWNVNAEYRFPIRRIEKGSGTDAFFFKRISGAVVADGLGAEGGSIKENQTFEARSLEQSFWSSGLELKLETTLGYVLPVDFVLGMYIPHSPQYSSSTQTGLSVQIGGF